MAQDVDVDFDHFGPEFAADPAGAFRELREKCPVAHTSRHDGFWVLTGGPTSPRLRAMTRRSPPRGIPPTPSPIRNVPIELAIHEIRVNCVPFRRPRVRGVWQASRRVGQ